jgi:hypothetical protein
MVKYFIYLVENRTMKLFENFLRRERMRGNDGRG